MPVETTDGLPCRFAAGSTVRFSLSYNDFPATDWTLSFSISGQSFLTVAATSDGTEFALVLTAAQTANLTPGQYLWSARVTETATGDSVIADKGSVVVCPDLSNTTVGPWRVRYNAALTAFDSLSAGTYASVSVEGQSFTMRDSKQQMDMLSWLESKAIAEDKLLGRATSGTTKKVVFYC